MLQNIPVELPAPIWSLFQWIWWWSWDLSEGKILTVARCRADDLCVGTNVDQETAVVTAVNIWKLARQAVMQARTSVMSSRSADTDASDDEISENLDSELHRTDTDASDVVNSVNSDELVENQNKWRPD